jgi:hypothetical protein
MKGGTCYSLLVLRGYFFVFFISTSCFEKHLSSQHVMIDVGPNFNQGLCVGYVVIISFWIFCCPPPPVDSLPSTQKEHHNTHKKHNQFNKFATVLEMTEKVEVV